MPPAYALQIYDSTTSSRGARSTYQSLKASNTVTTYGFQNALGVPVGTIIAWGSKRDLTSPDASKYLECDGSTFSKAKYPELYNVLGSTKLPNLNGQFLRGTTELALVMEEFSDRIKAHEVVIDPHTHSIDERTVSGAITGVAAGQDVSSATVKGQQYSTVKIENVSGQSQNAMQLVTIRKEVNKYANTDNSEELQTYLTDSKNFLLETPDKSETAKFDEVTKGHTALDKVHNDVIPYIEQQMNYLRYFINKNFIPEVTKTLNGKIYQTGILYSYPVYVSYTATDNALHYDGDRYFVWASEIDGNYVRLYIKQIFRTPPNTLDIKDPEKVYNKFIKDSSGETAKIFYHKTKAKCTINLTGGFFTYEKKEGKTIDYSYKEPFNTFAQTFHGFHYIDINNEKEIIQSLNFSEEYKDAPFGQSELTKKIYELVGYKVPKSEQRYYFINTESVANINTNSLHHYRYVNDYGTGEELLQIKDQWDSSNNLYIKRVNISSGGSSTSQKLTETTATLPDTTISGYAQNSKVTGDITIPKTTTSESGGQTKTVTEVNPVDSSELLGRYNGADETAPRHIYVRYFIRAIP